MIQPQKDIWDKAKIIAQIVAIIAVVIYGHFINSSIKEREINLQIVKVAVDILRTEPNSSTVLLREWAIQIVNNYSGIPLTRQVKKELLNEKLPTANIVTLGGDKVTLGGKGITFDGKSIDQGK